MISQEIFFGGAREHTISSDLQLSRVDRVRVITASTTGLEVKLPNATKCKLGGPHYYIINAGSNSFDIVNVSGTAISPAVTLQADKCATVLLTENDTADGTWKCIIEDTAGITPPVYTERAYIFGRDGNSTQAKVVQEYDTILNSWADKTSCNYDHDTGSSFNIGVYGYAIGSVLNPGHLHCEEYVGDTWTNKNDSNIAQMGTDILGKGYMVEYSGSRRVDEFDRTTGSFTAKNVCGASVSVYSWGGFEGKGYGSFGFGSLWDTTFDYTPGTDSWSDLSASPSTPSPTRTFSSADIANEDLYVCGGNNAGALDDCEQYDIATNAWSSITDTPQPFYAGATVGCNGDIYTMGGTGTVLLDTCYKWDVSGSSWSQKTDMNYTSNQIHFAGVSIVP